MYRTFSFEIMKAFAFWIKRMLTIFFFNHYELGIVIHGAIDGYNRLRHNRWNLIGLWGSLRLLNLHIDSVGCYHLFVRLTTNSLCPCHMTVKFLCSENKQNGWHLLFSVENAIWYDSTTVDKYAFYFYNLFWVNMMFSLFIIMKITGRQNKREKIRQEHTTIWQRLNKSLEFI